MQTATASTKAKATCTITLSLFYRIESTLKPTNTDPYQTLAFPVIDIQDQILGFVASYEAHYFLCGKANSHVVSRNPSMTILPVDAARSFHVCKETEQFPVVKCDRDKLGTRWRVCQAGYCRSASFHFCNTISNSNSNPSRSAYSNKKAQSMRLREKFSRRQMDLG